MKAAQPMQTPHKYPVGRGEWNRWLTDYAVRAAHGSKYGSSQLREIYTSIPSPAHPACRGTDRDRAAYWEVEFEPIKRRAVYERDGWRCGICRKAINPRAKCADPMKASLDHIVPMSLGGPHLYVNVQAAHLRCNLKKSWTGVGDQLALIG